MTTYYVRSTDGDNGDDGISWANAWADLQKASTVATAGDLVRVSDNHAAVYGSDQTFSWGGTRDNPIQVICVDDTTDLAVAGHASGGSESGGTSYHMQYSGGCVYLWGMMFQQGDGASSFTGGGSYDLENCKIRQNATTGTDQLTIATDNTIVRLKNTDYESFGGSLAEGHIKMANPSSLIWHEGTITGDMDCIVLIASEGPKIQIIGVDASALSGNNLISILSGAESFTLEMRGIKTHATTEPSLFTGTVPENSRISAHILDQSGSSAIYRFLEAHEQGTISDETTKIFTGKGMYDGTNEYSHNIIPDTTRDPTFYRPWRRELASKRVTGLSSEKTFTIEFALDHASAQPTAWDDDEIWIEVWGVDASTAQMTVQHDRITKPTDTPAAQTSSTGWAGLSNGREQKCSVTVPASTWQDGPVQVFLCIARTLPAATSLYICPEIVVS